MGWTIGSPGASRDNFLTVIDVDFDLLLGARPNIIFSNHVSLQPTLGFGFPSVFSIFVKNEVAAIPFVFFLDMLYHFHFPGLYPYLSAGIGYWAEYLRVPVSKAASGKLPTEGRFNMRAALNLGIGFSFMAGFKIGMTFSTEGILGPNQVAHLMLDIDYKLF